MVDRSSFERAIDESEQVVGTQHHILSTLARYSDWKTGENIRVSQSTIARVLGRDIKTVRQHIVASVSSGWLVRHTRGGRVGNEGVTAVYSLSIPSEVSGDAAAEIAQQVPGPLLDRGRQTPVGPGASDPCWEVPTGNLARPNRASQVGDPGRQTPTTMSFRTDTTNNRVVKEQIDVPAVAPTGLVVVDESIGRAPHDDGSAAPVEVLVEVVLRKLPDQLAGVIDRRRLTEKMARLPGLGWTPELLAKAVTDWSWTSARHGGAVIHWVDRLDVPPVPAVTRNRTRPDVEEAMAAVRSKLARFPGDRVDAAIAKSREITGRSASDLTVLRDALQTLSEAEQVAS